MVTRVTRDSLDVHTRPITNINVTGGTIDNTVIGSITPSTGSFTNLSASGNLNIPVLTAFGVGANLSSTNIAPSDLNNAITPGEYFYTSTTANVPDSTANGLLKVWRENTSWIYQLAQSAPLAMIYVRKYNNGTWTSWTKCGIQTTSGTTNPSNSTGNNGDFFINTTTGQILENISGSWTVIQDYVTETNTNIAPLTARLNSGAVNSYTIVNTMTNNDFNQTIIPGEYRFINTTANSPVPGGYGNVKVWSEFVGNAYQIVQTSGSSAMFVRFYYNAGGGWQPWNQIAFTASPELTGTPTVPTAGNNTASTQIASTQFVINQMNQFYWCQEQQNSGTISGNSIGAGFNTCILNTTLWNSIPGATNVSGNVFTLPAGTYWASGWVTFGFDAGSIGQQRGRVYLYNTNNNTVVISSASAKAQGGGSAVQEAIPFSGIFYISSSTTFSITQYLPAGASIGYAIGGPANEVWSNLLIQKLN